MLTLKNSKAIAIALTLGLLAPSFNVSAAEVKADESVIAIAAEATVDGATDAAELASSDTDSADDTESKDSVKDKSEKKSKDKSKKDTKDKSKKNKKKKNKKKKENLGKKIVEYANKHVGNPYRMGGNSLTRGCDCSGFVVQVYKKFGIDLSKTRNSRALRSVGKKVSTKNMQKGDIVCYNGHVAIYRGNGKIVEALNSRKGIVNYRGAFDDHIITVRRLV